MKAAREDKQGAIGARCAYFLSGVVHIFYSVSDKYFGKNKLF